MNTTYTHILSKVVLTSEESGLPTDVMFFSAGENITSRGSFFYDPTQASVLTLNQKNTDTRDRLPFDLAHLSTTDAPSLEAQKAYGWFTLEYAEDGIWARDIKFTDTGANLILNKEFRFLSPTFNADKDGNIKDIINIALTNWPATMGLQPLIAAAKKIGEDPIKDIMATTKNKNKDIVTLAVPAVEEEVKPVVSEEEPVVELDAKDQQIADLTAQLAEANTKLAECQTKLDEYQAAEIETEKTTLLSNLTLSDKEKTYWLKKNLSEIKEYIEVKSSNIDSVEPKATKVNNSKITELLSKKAPSTIISADKDKEDKHNVFLSKLKSEALQAANKYKV
jgi:hypothetical protein